MSTVEFERAAAQLKVADGDGRSLYNHLTEVVVSSLQSKTQALDKLEELSVRAKSRDIPGTAFKELPENPREPETKTAILRSVRQTEELLKSSAKPSKLSATVSDVVEDSACLEAVGVTLADDGYLRVQLAIAAGLPGIIETYGPVQYARWFGKIYGLNADYTVLEVQFVRAPEDTKEQKDEEPDKCEAAGTGANQFTYFVTTSLSQPKWTRLPNVRPEWISIARSMRRFFRGNLSAKVHGFPSFPWGEAALLRAQIARIAARCTLAPAGAFIESEMAGVVERDPEYQGMEVDGLYTLEGWTHTRKHLLKQGRTEPWVDPKADPDGYDDYQSGGYEEENEEEVEEPVDPLRSLADDQEPALDKRRYMVGGVVDEEGELTQGGGWTIRVTPNLNSVHNYVAVRSLVWPGAVSVAAPNSTNFVNVYLGWGTKEIGQNYTPAGPGDVQSEFTHAVDPDDDDPPPDPTEEMADPLPEVGGAEDEGYDDDEGGYDDGYDNY